MPKPPATWPPAALPRLMDVGQAAFYVGLSPTTFLERVKAGIYPEARRDGGRVLWDRHQLDAAIDGTSDVSALDDDDGIDKAEEERALRAIGG